jgi:hypothetical protein
MNGFVFLAHIPQVHFQKGDFHFLTPAGSNDHRNFQGIAKSCVVEA